MTDAERGAREAMEGFMAALNARDEDAVRQRWFHFPHVRFHSGKVTVYETPESFASIVIRMMGTAREWARSEWDYVDLVDAGPDKVHFRVQFSRYRADGSLIGAYKSFYIVTFKDGRWAIQGRSSWAE